MNKNILTNIAMIIVIAAILIVPYIVWNNIKVTSIILVLLSGLSVIITLLFDNKLKTEKKDNKFLNLTNFGIILFFVFIISTILNGNVAYRNIIDNENKSYNDSIRFANKSNRDSITFAKKSHTDSIRSIESITTQKDIIKKLKEKRVKDSAELIELKADVKRIDTTLVKNALAEIIEQRKKADYINENTYISFKTEVAKNLKTILIDYSDENIEKCKDTTKVKVFIMLQLDNEFIHKYIQISNNASINEYLMNTIQAINIVNYFRASVLTVASKNRNFEINQFIANRDKALNILLPIYKMTNELNSYKSFTKAEKIYNLSKLTNDKLKDDLLLKFKIERIINP